jgi:predicted RNA-binding protein YlqC (UPF0109 family)
VRPVFAHLARGWGNPKAEAQSIVAVERGDKRMIANLDKPEESELFDTSADPKEQNNVLSKDGAEADAMRTLIQGYEKRDTAPWGKKPGVAELDEMRLNQLRALGYAIEGDEPARPKQAPAQLPPEQ